MQAHSISDIRSTVRELAPWHFAIDVAPGIRTTDFNRESYGDVDLDTVGTIDPDEMRGLFRTCLPDGGVAKRSFLDVGCNGGGYCFVAHELGATACYGFDVRDRWIRQAEFIRSVKYPTADTLKFMTADVNQVEHDRTYDVTLFKGVFYHLPDPIGTLHSLCALTERAIIVDSASRSDIPPYCLAPSRESTTHVMSGVYGLNWFPGGPQAIQPILAWSGFAHMRVVRHKKGGPADRFRGRFAVLATRLESDLAAYDAAQGG